jgi:hypothetical protein
MRCERVDVDDRFAAIELVHDRLEIRMPQPFVAVAGVESDAVGLELIERVFDLLQRAFDVRHRHECEQAEAAGMILHGFDHVFVDQTRQMARLLGIEVRKVETCRQRQDRGADAAAIHLVEGRFQLPALHHRGIANARLLPGVQQKLRKEVMVHVDPMRARGGRRRCALSPSRRHPQRRGGAERGQGFEEEAARAPTARGRAAVMVGAGGVAIDRVASHARRLPKAGVDCSVPRPGDAPSFEEGLKRASRPRAARNK